MGSHQRVASRKQNVTIKDTSVWRLHRKEGEIRGRETSESGGSGCGEKCMDWRAFRDIDLAGLDPSL